MQALCALVFGKEEDFVRGGGFEFTQELVNDIVTFNRNFLTGLVMVPFIPTLPAYFLRPLVHLCISGASVLVEPG